MHTTGWRPEWQMPALVQVNILNFMTMLGRHAKKKYMRQTIEHTGCDDTMFACRDGGSAPRR